MGEAVRVARIELDLSQEELAEKAGLARNYIGNIERAEKRISLDTLASVAKALGTTVHDLTRGI